MKNSFPSILWLTDGHVTWPSISWLVAFLLPVPSFLVWVTSSIWIESSWALGNCVYLSGEGNELIPLTCFFPSCTPVRSSSIVDTTIRALYQSAEGPVIVVDTMFQGTASVRECHLVGSCKWIHDFQRKKWRPKLVHIHSEIWNKTIRFHHIFKTHVC